MTPDFEWIRKPFRDGDGELVIRHYLVDPCGQVRADIDEPMDGRLSHIADLYWLADDNKYSNWVTLDLAKAYVESRYRNLLAHNFRKRRRAKIHAIQTPQTRRHGRGPAEKGHGFGGLAS